METVKSLQENPVYRVTDVVHRKGIRWQQDRATILRDPSYQHTILYEYLKRMRHEDDIKLFRAILRRRQRLIDLPSRDSLVVHLRLGDVMDDHDDQRWRSFDYCRAVYSQLVLPSLPALADAVIVTALHFGANDLNGKYFFSSKAVDRSYQLLDIVTRRLSSFGLPVSIKSSESVDEDLCFMAASRYFVKGISGLSDLISHCLPHGALIWTPGSRVVQEKARFPRLRNRIRRLKQLMTAPPGSSALL